MTDGTFDAFLWQLLEKKQRFIAQVNTSKSPVHSFEDVDTTVLQYAEIKSMCAGDPRINERMELEVDVTRLQILKTEHKNRQYDMENRLAFSYPGRIAGYENTIKWLAEDISVRDAHPLPKEGFAGMEVLGQSYSDREAAGAALLEACRQARAEERLEVGSYRGFRVFAERDGFAMEVKLLLHHAACYPLEIGTSATGVISRLENRLGKLDAELHFNREQLEQVREDMTKMREDMDRPFPHEAELQAKIQRSNELKALLDLNKRSPAPANFARDMYGLLKECLPGEIPGNLSEEVAVENLMGSIRAGRIPEVREKLHAIDRGPFSLTQKELAHGLLENLKMFEEKWVQRAEKRPEGPEL